MARSPDVLEDPTPLDAAYVDVRVRIAWLLRTCRTFGVAGDPVSVTEMAARLKRHGIPASAPSVSGWETGRVAPGTAVVEAYESVLGREPGSLRAVVDLVRRRFSDEGPRSAAPLPTVEDLDAAVEGVTATTEPRGLDWLHFSETALAVRPGLPSAFLRPLVARLLCEMSRAAFTAYTTRYEALALLRCGMYADVVADVVAAFFDEPGNLLLGDVASLIAERPDARAARILAGQLASEEFLRLRAGVVGLQHVATTGSLGAAAWRPVVPAFVEAWELKAGDPLRRRQLVELWRTLPVTVQETVADRLGVRVDTDPEPRPWEPGGLDDQLQFCATTADQVTDALDLPGQPLLARLLFEALFEARYARRLTSSILLMASPFRGPIAVELGAAALEHDEAGVRRAAATLLLLIGQGETHDHLVRLLDSDDTVVVTGAIFALAHSRSPLPDERLEALLQLPSPLDRRALFYAGLTAHPVLDRVGSDPGHPLRVVAQWWQRHGTLVLT